jgi:hypothetical protein
MIITLEVNLGGLGLFNQSKILECNGQGPSTLNVKKLSRIKCFIMNITLSGLYLNFCRSWYCLRSVFQIYVSSYKSEVNLIVGSEEHRSGSLVV